MSNSTLSPRAGEAKESDELAYLQRASDPRFIFLSAGVKNGLGNLPLADLYLDCRSMVNPYHEAGLGGLTGDDPRVIAFVEEQNTPVINAFLALIWETLERIPSRRRSRPDPFLAPIRVCCVCAHGIHRSRAMKHILARRIQKEIPTAGVEIA